MSYDPKTEHVIYNQDNGSRVAKLPHGWDVDAVGRQSGISGDSKYDAELIEAVGEQPGTYVVVCVRPDTPEWLPDFIYTFIVTPVPAPRFKVTRPGRQF